MPREPHLLRQWDRYYAYPVARAGVPVVLALAYRKNQSRRNACALAKLPKELLLLTLRHYRAVPLPKRPKHMSLRWFRIYMGDSDRRLLFEHYKAVWSRKHSRPALLQCVCVPCVDSYQHCQHCMIVIND